MACMREKINAYGILVGIPERKNKLEDIGMLEDNIKMGINEIG